MVAVFACLRASVFVHECIVSRTEYSAGSSVVVCLALAVVVDLKDAQ